eukprot:SAG11_NODE_7073_length_1198_cov_1.622384_1_plen_44_part_10
MYPAVLQLFPLQTDLIHKGVQNTVQPFVFLHTKFSTKFETGFGT